MSHKMRTALEMELNEILDEKRKVLLKKLTPEAYEKLLDYFAKSPLSTATKNFDGSFGNETKNETGCVQKNVNTRSCL